MSKIVGTPAAHSSSSGRAASSSSVTSISSPGQPRLSIAGAPGLSIRVTLVPVSLVSERDDEVPDPCVADVESHRQAIDRSGIVHRDAVLDAYGVIVGNRERN